MSPRFLKQYKVAVDEAGRLGMKMGLYDEFWFPGGSAGGLLAKKHPEAIGKRLDMLAALYATGFVKTIRDWCATHRMDLTGHADQEELVNPVIGTVGDLIKSFKYQSMPGIDRIGAYGRASRAYEVVGSAANNYDRPQVVNDVFDRVRGCRIQTWDGDVVIEQV